MQNTVILRGRDLFGTTVIDNRFISELVPDAPENAVRVYLYGLMLAGGAVSSPVSISDALKLSDAQVAEAFRYWEKCGIVRIIDGSLLSVEYLNLSASLPDKRPVDNENAHYTKLVQRLQAVLGTRNMSGAELQKVYDWVEIFGFEDDAALLIVQHCIEKRAHGCISTIWIRLPNVLFPRAVQPLIRWRKASQWKTILQAARPQF